jgi:hypothetical protein
MRDTEFEALKLLMKKVHQHVADLEAENARLREGLKIIAGHDPATCNGIMPADCVETMREVARALLSQGQTGEGEPHD